MLDSTDFFGGRERGVSPVIGVILMVAITVVLAAGIAAFAFGYGGNQAGPAPTPAVESSVDDQQVTFSIDSGDSFDPEDAEMDVEVTVVDTASGSTDTVSFSTSLDASQTKSVTVDGTTYDVDYVPSISGDEVAAGDSFQLSLGSGAGPDIEIANYDASVVWSESSGSSQVLYSDTYNEPAAASGGGGGGCGGAGDSSSGISTSLDTTCPPSQIDIDFTGGTSFDGSDYDVNFEVQLEDASGTPDQEIFSNDADVSSPIVYSGSAAGDPVFHLVGGGSLEYESFAGADGDFSSGDSMVIRITADDPDVEVIGYRIAIIEESTGAPLYQTTVTT